MLEFKSQVLSLEIIRDTILENYLGDFLVLGIKIYSRIIEHIGIEKNPYLRVDMEIQMCKAFIE